MTKTHVGDIEMSLRKNITSGVFMPSEPLRMEPLRERYETGFSPIREALSRILADGLVELEPNRGFRVAAMSREDLFDIAFARIAVETAAVRRAIELGDERWEADLVGAMYRFEKLSGLSKFDDEQKLAAWEEAHDALHTAIISACAMSTSGRGLTRTRTRRSGSRRKDRAKPSPGRPTPSANTRSW